MEKLLYIMLIWVVSTTSIYSQTVAGKIVDESNQPIEFANIVCLSLPDSTFIYGTISDQDGKFTIPENSSKGILRISSVGYATTYKECKDRNIGTILLHSDTQLLGEVVVKGNLPVTRMKGDALVTSVQNSVLAKAGSANDVLGKVPGILKDKDSFEVFGKGTPLIYINGREVRDKSELEQLSSEDIKHVELITNPGARYDATVNAVVRIQTIRRTGDGFGFNLNSSYYQSENVDLVEQADVNYRHNGLDMFAMFRYDKMEFRERTNVHQTLISKKQLDLENQLKYNDNKQWLRGNIGMNYMFDENNSIGVKYTLKANPDARYHTIFNSDVYADGTHYDYLANDINATAYYNPSHSVNVYYKGMAGKTEIDFNADYLFDKNGDNTIQREESSNKEDRVVTSTNTLRSELFAAKLVLSRPLLGGNVMIGAEYSHTERQDDYVNPEGYVPTSFSELKEQNISPFLEYSRNTPIGQLSVGGRYEWVNFDYYEDGKYMEGQSRNFSNFFPSVSLGSEIGGVQLQLSYAAKTRRPSYQQLSNNVTYANRFTLQSGNPLLEHEVVHNVSLMGAWKFMQFSMDYNDRRNAIIYWGEQMEYNPAVTLISFKNLHSLKSVSAFLSLAPKFGIWSPQLNWGVQKQWLDLETTDGLLKMNKPMFTGAFNNTFNFNHGWMASVEMNYQSKGDMENCSETKNIFYVDAGVTKFFWGDRMSVKLSGTDLFHGMKSGNRMYYNRASSLQINNYDSRKVMLTVRYKFNATRNKYKGSGAGESEKERL